MIASLYDTDFYAWTQEQAGNDAVRTQIEADLGARDHLSATAVAAKVAPMMPRLDAMIADQSLRYALKYGGMTAK